MNFYIDFDHTLYNTAELIEDLINVIAKYILENGDFEQFSIHFKEIFPNLEQIIIEKNLESITNVLRDNFKRPEETYLKIDYNIYALSKTFCNLFSCNNDDIKKKIDSIIENGNKYLFSDSIRFLKSLKKQGFNVYILSHEKNDLNFQNLKICGSGLFSEEFINGIILSKISKAFLDENSLNDPSKVYIASTNKKIPEYIDYENGIFIDDRPKDLENLCKACYKNDTSKKIRVFRIERPNQKYSNMPFSEDFRYSSKISIIKCFDELSIT